MLKKMWQGMLKKSSIQNFEREAQSAHLGFQNNNLFTQATREMLRDYHRDRDAQSAFMRGLHLLESRGHNDIAFETASMPLVNHGRNLHEDFRDACIEQLKVIGTKPPQGQYNFWAPVQALMDMARPEDARPGTADHAVELVNICAKRDMKQAVEMSFACAFNHAEELNPLIYETMMDRTRRQLIKDYPVHMPHALNVRIG